MLLEKPHGIARLQVVRKDEDTDLRVGAPDLLGRDEAFVGVGRGHLDVDEDDVRPPEVDETHELLAGPGLPDDIEACLDQQASQALAQEQLVVGNHDPHGISATSFTEPPASRARPSDPSTAPTRSSISSRKGSGMSEPSTSTVSRDSLRRALIRSGPTLPRAASATT